MKLAYADPPYLGEAKDRYDDPTYDDPKAHEQLIERLCDEYPGGWAVSLHVPSLEFYLKITPEEDRRIGTWVKTFGVYKANVTKAWVWEPVIFWRGQERPREKPTIRDWVSCPITLQKGVVGAKPEQFGLWIFEFLSCTPDDEVTPDLFPGSGAMQEHYETWKSMAKDGEWKRIFRTIYPKTRRVAA